MSTALLIAADATLSSAWSTALEDHGIAVLVAANATDGILRIREGGVDVVVIDIAPAGLAALVAELAKIPDAPPFVMVSGSSTAPGVSAHLGAAAFVPKPCTPGDLVDVILPIVRHVVAVEDEPTSPRRGSF